MEEKPKKKKKGKKRKHSGGDLLMIRDYIREWKKPGFGITKPGSVS